MMVILFFGLGLVAVPYFSTARVTRAKAAPLG